MKLTKSQLKQTVKEELEGILNEEGTSPKELGLPLDVGTPEKLLQGLQALLANPEQIEKDNITHIVNLINKQLMKNPDEAAAAALKAAKDEVIGLDPGMSKMRSWRQARRDKAREDAEGAHTPSTSRDFYSSGGPTFEGKLKITKSQLKQIIQEELESLFSEGRYSYHADVPAGGYADEWERGADAAAATGQTRQQSSPEEENIDAYLSQPGAKPWRSLTRDQQRTVERKGAEAIYYV